MSIEISSDCIGCRACIEVCPGNLITISEGKANIDAPWLCWGCASCVKECARQAISLYLGQDIGGLGGKLNARQEGTFLHWTITLPNGETKTIVTDRAVSNQY
jgi:adenylylsulfate reductase subunit B